MDIAIKRLIRSAKYPSKSTYWLSYKKPILSHIFPNKEFMRYKNYVFINVRKQNRQKGKGVSAS